MRYNHPNPVCACVCVCIYVYVWLKSYVLPELVVGDKGPSVGKSHIGGTGVTDGDW